MLVKCLLARYNKDGVPEHLVAEPEPDLSNLNIDEGDCIAARELKTCQMPAQIGKGVVREIPISPDRINKDKRG